MTMKFKNRADHYHRTKLLNEVRKLRGAPSDTDFQTLFEKCHRAGIPYEAVNAALWGSHALDP